MFFREATLRFLSNLYLLNRILSLPIKILSHLVKSDSEKIRLKNRRPRNKQETINNANQQKNSTQQRHQVSDAISQQFSISHHYHSKPIKPIASQTLAHDLCAAPQKLTIDFQMRRGSVSALVPKTDRHTKTRGCSLLRSTLINIHLVTTDIFDFRIFFVRREFVTYIYFIPISFFDQV